MKILWNYGKLIFHAHRDDSLNINTAISVCLLGFWYGSYSACVENVPGASLSCRCFNYECSYHRQPVLPTTNKDNPTQHK